jgi:hypothetical protein
MASINLNTLDGLIDRLTELRKEIGRNCDINISCPHTKRHLRITMVTECSCPLYGEESVNIEVSMID